MDRPLFRTTHDLSGPRTRHPHSICPSTRAQPRKVLIIGAGPGRSGRGDAAGASAGCTFTSSSDCRASAGGARRIEADGFRFDLGPTFFLYPRVLERIFAAVGRDLHARSADGPARPAVPPGLRRRRRARLHARRRADRSRGREALPRRRRRTSAASSTTTASSWTRSGPCLETPVPRLARPALAGDLLKLLPLLRPWRSLDGELGRYFTRPARAAGVLVPVASTSACRRSTARACSRSCRSWNTSTASGTRSAAAAR